MPAIVAMMIAISIDVPMPPATSPQPMLPIITAATSISIRVSFDAASRMARWRRRDAACTCAARDTGPTGSARRRAS